MSIPHPTPSNVSGLPEGNTTSQAYTPPELTVLEVVVTENNPGVGADAGGYLGHNAS